MSLTICARRRILFSHLQVPVRHYSSTHVDKQAARSPQAESHTTLPPAKMRALIALYHQADAWITEDTLLDRIDKAFVPELNSSTVPMDHDYLHGRGANWTRVDDLEKTRLGMVKAPKMAQYDRSQAGDLGIGSNWSGRTSKRELKVIEALYGVDARADELSPGLEVLQETAESLDRDEDGADVRDLLQQ